MKNTKKTQRGSAPALSFLNQNITEMNQMIVSSVFIILLSIWVARRHAIKKLKGETIHMYEKDLKAFFFWVGSISCSLLVQASLGIDLNFADTIYIFFYLNVLHWITFDLSMNLFSGESIDYISDNRVDHNDAITDRVFHWMPEKVSGWAQIGVKTVLFAFLIWQTSHIWVMTEGF